MPARCYWEKRQHKGFDIKACTLDCAEAGFACDISHRRDIFAFTGGFLTWGPFLEKLFKSISGDIIFFISSKWSYFNFCSQHMKRSALQNKQVGMAFRARKVFWTFEKRAPDLHGSWNITSVAWNIERKINESHANCFHTFLLLLCCYMSPQFHIPSVASIRANIRLLDNFC